MRTDMSRPDARGWMLLGALWLGGCVPLPAALPPAKASLGIGAAAGNPLPDASGAALRDVTPVAVGRVGITPQTVFEEQHRRPVEVEGGYTFQVFTDELRQNRNRHGAYLGASVLLGDIPLPEQWSIRFTIRGFAEYLVMQDHPGDGGGASWAVGLELARYNYSLDDSPTGISFLGWMAGEWSVGAELYGGVYSLGGYEYGVFGFALTGRWPALLGIGLIPLTGSF